MVLESYVNSVHLDLGMGLCTGLAYRGSIPSAMPILNVIQVFEWLESDAWGQEELGWQTPKPLAWTRRHWPHLCTDNARNHALRPRGKLAPRYGVTKWIVELYARERIEENLSLRETNCMVTSVCTYNLKGQFYPSWRLEVCMLQNMQILNLSLLILCSPIPITA